MDGDLAARLVGRRDGRTCGRAAEFRELVPKSGADLSRQTTRLPYGLWTDEWLAQGATCELEQNCIVETRDMPRPSRTATKDRKVATILLESWFSGPEASDGFDTEIFGFFQTYRQPTELLCPSRHNSWPL